MTHEKNQTNRKANVIKQEEINIMQTNKETNPAKNVFIYQDDIKCKFLFLFTFLYFS